MGEDIGWIKILITAVVSSVCTAAVAKPIRRWLEGRRLRRAVYQEIVQNFAALHRQVGMAKHDPAMIPGIGRRFAMSYKRLAYDMGQKDPAAFYSIGWNELYWIELLYRGFDRVVKDRFDNDAQRLSSADSTARELVDYVKKRRLSQHLMLKISPKVERSYFKESLPKVPYLDVEPPGRIERMRRIWDRFQYWCWRRDPSEPSVWLEVPSIIKKAADLEQSGASFGGSASDRAKEYAAQNVDDLRARAFFSAVHDYLLHGGNDEWRRWKRRGWVPWSESRLLDVRPAAPDTGGESGRGA